MLTIAIISALCLLGIGIIYQDYKSLTINANLIYAYFTVAIGSIYFIPLPDVGWKEQMLGMVIAGALTVGIRQYYIRIRKMDGLGEADVWLIAAAGALIGPHLLGPWMLSTTILAIFLLTFGKKISGIRLDPDGSDEQKVMPFTPSLIVTSLALTISIHAGLIAADKLPY